MKVNTVSWIGGGLMMLKGKLREKKEGERGREMLRNMTGESN